MTNSTTQHRALWWTAPSRGTENVVQYVLQKYNGTEWEQVQIFPKTTKRMYYNPEIGSRYRIGVVFKKERAEKYYTYYSNVVFIDEYAGYVAPFSGKHAHISSSIINSIDASTEQHISLPTYQVNMLYKQTCSQQDTTTCNNVTNASTDYLNINSYSVFMLYIKKWSEYDPNTISCNNPINGSLNYITMPSYSVVYLKGSQIGGP